MNRRSNRGSGAGGHGEGSVVTGPSEAGSPPLEVSIPAQSACPDPRGAAAVGQTITGAHRYTIVKKIGEGGMGEVFLAVGEGNGQRVAIKMIRADRCNARAVEAFAKECDKLARLDHQGIITLIDHGVWKSPEGERPFLVMKYVPGAKSITKYASDKKLDHRDRVKMFLKACAPLIEQMHRRALWHFDLKPGNILVDSHGKVYICDLGVARAAMDPQIDLPGGTVEYMSPEHLAGDPDTLDARCDIFSMGVVLYELLAGRRPRMFREGASRRECRDRLMVEPAPSMRAFDPKIPLKLDRIVSKAMALEPDDRYESLKGMAADLDEYLDGSKSNPGPRPRWRDRAWVQRTALCVVGIALAVAGAYPGAWIIDKTGLGDQYWRAVRKAAPPLPPVASLSNVAIVRITRDTDIAGLTAQYAGGVSETESPTARRLHGVLGSRLARVGVRGVLWDLDFPENAGSAAADDQMAEGISKLRGTTIAFATFDWSDPRGNNNPAILGLSPEVGGISILSDTREGNEGIWVPLAVRSEGGMCVPALSLIGYAANRHPGAHIDVQLDERSQQMTLRYTKPDPDKRALAVPVAMPEVIPVTIEHYRPGPGISGPDSGLHQGDLVALAPLELPDAKALLASIRSMQDVLDADDASLRKWFSGKVVVVGDEQKDQDRFSHQDHVFYGSVRHASEADALTRGLLPRVPDSGEQLGLNGMAAGVGTLLGGVAVLVAGLGRAAAGRWAPGEVRAGGPVYWALCAAVVLIAILFAALSAVWFGAWAYRSLQLIVPGYAMLACLGLGALAATFTLTWRLPQGSASA